MHLLIVSCAAIGHIGPCLSLAEALLEAEPSNFVTLCTLVTPEQQATVAQMHKSSRIRLHVVPEASNSKLPFDPDYWNRKHEINAKFRESIMKEPIPPPSCLIFDMFAGWSLPLAEAYNIPAFLFMPCSLRFCCACAFADEYKFLSAHPMTSVALAGSDTTFPSDVLACLAVGYWHWFIKCVDSWKLTHGVLINDIETFSSPELNHKMTHFAALASPYRIYNMGPVGLKKKVQFAQKRDHANLWLDQHSPSSVIFVAFGSWCALPLQDAAELAYALRQIQKPVLWAYRGRKPQNENFCISNRLPNESFDDDGLPVGFRDSLDPDQFLITPWLDQKAVLQHSAIAMFVTHCGWNSILEAMTLMGKPMAALPIQAEQVKYTPIL